MVKVVDPLLLAQHPLTKSIKVHLQNKNRHLLNFKKLKSLAENRRGKKHTKYMKFVAKKTYS